MLNIEKYKDEIKVELEKDKILGCVVNKLMGNTCDDYPKCIDCYLKVLDWLLQEYEEPILTEEEKIIIKNIMEAFEPLGKKLNFISKECWNFITNDYYLNFRCEYDGVGALNFNAGELFKGMELDKRYTLKGLGL